MNQLEIFRDICRDMYHASDLIEMDSNGKILYLNNYGKVVSMIIDTKHGRLVSDGLSLSDVGFIFGVTRERARQTLLGTIGTEVSAKCKITSMMGARDSYRMKIDNLGRTTDKMRTIKRGRL